MPDHIGRHLTHAQRALNRHPGRICGQLQLCGGQNPARHQRFAAQVRQGGGDVIPDLIGRNDLRQRQTDRAIHPGAAVSQRHRQGGVLQETEWLLVKDRQGRCHGTFGFDPHCRWRIAHRGVGDLQHRPRHIQIATLRGRHDPLIQHQRQRGADEFCMSAGRSDWWHKGHEPDRRVAKFAGQRQPHRHIRRDA